MSGGEGILMDEVKRKRKQRSILPTFYAQLFNSLDLRCFKVVYRVFHRFRQAKFDNAMVV
jgi:hypothetical protein